MRAPETRANGVLYPHCATVNSSAGPLAADLGPIFLFQSANGLCGRLGSRTCLGISRVGGERKDGDGHNIEGVWNHTFTFVQTHEPATANISPFYVGMAC